jgi:hypothetical protein
VPEEKEEEEGEEEEGEEEEEEELTTFNKAHSKPDILCASRRHQN